MSVETCHFRGIAQSVTLRGDGPAVLVEPDVFKSGHGQVELLGASLHFEVPGNDSALAGPNLTLREWKRLEPVTPAFGPFEAQYSHGISSLQNRKVEIRLKPGGDAGWFQGQEPGGGRCVSEAACEIRWGGDTKTIVYETSGLEELPLSQALPGGPIELHAVELRNADGMLTCGGNGRSGKWTLVQWQRGPSGALSVGPVKLQRTGLEVEVDNDGPPQMSWAPPWTIWLAGAAAILILAVVAWRSLSRKRRVQSNQAKPPSDAPIEVRPEVSEPVRIFVSYAHEDDGLRAELGAQLKALELTGLVKLWHDRKIVPGGNWEQEISSEIEQAEIVLLLVSADFINSAYCMGKEYQRAKELEIQRRMRILPVILRACPWSELPLARSQALPKDGKPVTDAKTWPSHDEAWMDVVDGVKRAAKSLRM